MRGGITVRVKVTGDDEGTNGGEGRRRRARRRKVNWRVTRRGENVTEV